jgi:hypothetical protein
MRSCGSTSPSARARACFWTCSASRLIPFPEPMPGAHCRNPVPPAEVATPGAAGQLTDGQQPIGHLDFERT